ncbi:hypothetical protein DSO57_1015191 [Entomophthora muscae]|uniref:Uncharacterized protein n=1 Tax=Entomophthora muscae TaxID=34485 RepID=A0ACC2S773_9FUNG|nr:hypothetical protein DSO57_1015191 [Entomophthora muscae]
MRIPAAIEMISEASLFSTLASFSSIRTVFATVGLMPKTIASADFAASWLNSVILTP